MPYSPLQLADAYIKAGELSDALTALDSHLAESPNDSDARRLRAQVLAHIPNAAERRALGDLESIPQPIAEDYILRSVLLERLGQQDEALATIEQGHIAFPDDARLAERYLMMLRARGKFVEALAVANRLPDDWRRTQWAGDLAVDLSDDAQAITHYSAAINALETRYSHLLPSRQPATILTDAANDAAALTIAAAYGRLRLARADSHRRLNQLDAADVDYTAAEILLPGDPVIPFNRGLTAVLRGDIDQAVTLCRRALDSASAALKIHLIATLENDSRFTTLRHTLKL